MTEISNFGLCLFRVSLREYMDEIYLGEGAKSYQIFFEKVLSNSEKVKTSENPFRINRNL